MENSGVQKLSTAIFSIRHHPDASGFKGRQKTASLNFCAPCRIFRHFPSTDYGCKNRAKSLQIK